MHHFELLGEATQSSYAAQPCRGLHPWRSSIDPQPQDRPCIVILFSNVYDLLLTLRHVAPEPAFLFPAPLRGLCWRRCSVLMSRSDEQWIQGRTELFGGLHFMKQDTLMRELQPRSVEERQRASKAAVKNLVGRNYFPLSLSGCQESHEQQQIPAPKRELWVE